MNKSKRLLSLALALLMVISLLPAATLTALAAGDGIEILSLTLNQRELQHI